MNKFPHKSNTQPAFKIIQPALKINQTILAKLKIEEIKLRHLLA